MKPIDIVVPEGIKEIEDSCFKKFENLLLFGDLKELIMISSGILLGVAGSTCCSRFGYLIPKFNRLILRSN